MVGCVGLSRHLDAEERAPGSLFNRSTVEEALLDLAMRFPAVRLRTELMDGAHAADVLVTTTACLASHHKRQQDGYLDSFGTSRLPSSPPSLGGVHEACKVTATALCLHSHLSHKMATSRALASAACSPPMPPWRVYTQHARSQPQHTAYVCCVCSLDGYLKSFGTSRLPSSHASLEGVHPACKVTATALCHLLPPDKAVAVALKYQSMGALMAAYAAQSIYRGYRLSEGQLSEGKPTEKGLKEDARAALAHLAENPAVDGSRVVIFGRSLGGAVALHLAAEKPIQVIEVMVENTFTSVEDMVSRVVPPLGLIIGTGKPGNFLVTNKWRNNEAIGQLDEVPLLMLVSGQDEMVPSEQMYSLHKLQRSKQCKLVEFPLSSHMDAYDKEPVRYWCALTEFMDQFK
ncbi:hypothetical protein DUNSADRAFT_7453 [Dunaliella salina]|uniref:Peptidase S9 prolyl oligopeptidase catalytic domain-containing protein n=1 Tax=Dunaliella salina TaxID=3046 RepID=A0ABQ7GLD3_DUNSA|nr:hypothetical protein DUNSADRAFT_7453 [Dunaliella salina]KAF5835419.1 hypothetical protein DUNSADRAFT_7453 [Dunaliella salina]|eukprot:KAF5835418.1 hypothetical protein DUNSADRAFT_7453 [Dunaliella salina]